MTRENTTKDPLSRVLLQNLRILGTGQGVENHPGDKPQIVPTVTLEVSPAKGERLALAAQAGRISLVLRGQGDSQLVLTKGVNAGSLFGPTEKVQPAAAASKLSTPSLAVPPKSSGGCSGNRRTYEYPSIMH